MFLLFLCLLAAPGAAGKPRDEQGGNAIIGLTYALEPVGGTDQYCGSDADCWAAMRDANRNPRVDWVAIQMPKD